MENDALLKVAFPIMKFQGVHRFLSNFYPSLFEFETRKYKTVEHLYQASKARTTPEHEFIRIAKTAKEAKQRGRDVSIRHDWDDIKIEVMRNCLLLKFASDKLAEQLLGTHNATLIEGNTWHDNFWGDCSCEKCIEIKGYNILGALLMELRFRLQV